MDPTVVDGLDPQQVLEREEPRSLTMIELLCRINDCDLLIVKYKVFLGLTIQLRT
jgi:hypothetical protein